MTTQFPGAIDGYTDPVGPQTLATNHHKQRHIDLQDAMVAVQTTVGVSGSADPNSIEYRVTQASAAASGTASALAQHAAAAAPHAGHATPASVGQAIDAHVGLSNPHAQYVQTASLAASARGAGIRHVITPSAGATTGTVYLFAHPAQLAGHVQTGSKEVFVPIGADAVDGVPMYFGVAIGQCGVATRVPSMVETGIFKPAQHTSHTSASKTGTWTTGPANIAAGALTSSGATSSGTSGDTIAATVTGRTVGIQFYATSNGGYGVVAIDGDYTKPNRLPKFTADDYAAGRCRQADVGRAYYDSWAPAPRNDSLVVSDDLSAGAHTITVQVTGTSRAGASGVRAYVEHFWAAASVTPGAAGVFMVPIHPVCRIVGGSAITWVASWAPNGSTDFQFLGDVHSDNSAQSVELTTNLQWFSGYTDQTALAPGLWASGAIVTLRHATTLAHKSALGTPIATKSRIYTFAPRAWPVMCDLEVAFLADGVVSSEYPVMLPLGGIQETAPFASGEIDGQAFALTNQNNNTNVLYAGVCGQLRVSGARAEARHTVIEASPSLMLRSSVIGSYQDRTTPGDEKLYVIAQITPQSVAAGEKRHYLLGFGANKL